MLLRQLVISVPADNTCQWIHNIPSFRTWEERPDSGNHNGLLQIVGKPGSGKSTLMRSVFESTRSLARTRNDGTCVLSHFFNHRGDTLEHSEKGMLHSIFHQLGTLYPPCFDAFPGGSRLADLQHLELADPRAYNSALRETLKRIFSDSSLSPPRTTIFIDALDECDGDEAAGLGYFLAELTIKARGSGIQLDVCISRREYPSITFRNSIEIQMEVYNSQDIQQYIDQKLDLAAVLPEDATGLRSAIAERANGIFLWVVLAVEGILKDLESGTNIKRIINRTKSLPKELEDLFAQILDGMDSDQLQMALRLFQWAVLPTDRLRIREWHHILAFLREEPFCSLREWRESEHYTETDAQLERQIRHLSRGLIEVKAGIDVSDPSAEVASLLAGAGSLDSTTGDSRVVPTRLLSNSLPAGAPTLCSSRPPSTTSSGTATSPLPPLASITSRSPSLMISLPQGSGIFRRPARKAAPLRPTPLCLARRPPRKAAPLRPYPLCLALSVAVAARPALCPQHPLTRKQMLSIKPSLLRTRCGSTTGKTTGKTSRKTSGETSGRVSMYRRPLGMDKGCCHGGSSRRGASTLGQAKTSGSGSSWGQHRGPNTSQRQADLSRRLCQSQRRNSLQRLWARNRLWPTTHYGSRRSRRDLARLNHRRHPQASPGHGCKMIQSPGAPSLPSAQTYRRHFRNTQRWHHTRSTGCSLMHRGATRGAPTQSG